MFPHGMLGAQRRQRSGGQWQGDMQLLVFSFGVHQDAGGIPIDVWGWAVLGRFVRNSILAFSMCQLCDCTEVYLYVFVWGKRFGATTFARIPRKPPQSTFFFHRSSRSRSSAKPIGFKLLKRWDRRTRGVGCRWSHPSAGVYGGARREAPGETFLLEVFFNTHRLR